ncbi:MAG: FMN-binding protein [Lachnospiraceae bacterium]|nr:FMN-binding protein [Lachnospiraceae bacterium]
MKKSAILLAAAVCAASLAGCGGSSAKNYKDGTYEGKSSVYQNEDGDSEEGNGYGVVSITIKDNKITDCTFTTYETDGTEKGEDYGLKDGDVANRDYYNKAQKAVAACAEYANRLVANGSLDGIDAISGATINYNEFQEAVTEALKSAEE